MMRMGIYAKAALVTFVLKKAFLGVELGIIGGDPNRVTFYLYE
jgi:hypothetical protein